jgi:hypothetical protein
MILKSVFMHTTYKTFAGNLTNSNMTLIDVLSGTMKNGSLTMKSMGVRRARRARIVMDGSNITITRINIKQKNVKLEENVVSLTVLITTMKEI